jgi:pimeloyl-ACP methyl ester carboxylesterase
VTLFVDLRATPSGGIVAAETTVWEDGTRPLSAAEFGERVRGLDVLLAAHGFNVDRQHGIDALSKWSQLCELPPSSLFVGVLWPGDSQFFPVIDYPFEGTEAIASGKLLAAFLNDNAASAASLSFVSHSLGARTVLEAVTGLNLSVRRLILMAGAIEGDCLVNEYQSAAARAAEIFVLSSRSDAVLEFAFPVGNLVGEIVMRGHPYYRTALGRDGPSQPILLSQRGGAWQIPDDWRYGHLDYLPRQATAPQIPPPVAVPEQTSEVPMNPPVDGWKPSWSAGAVSTQMD